VRQSLDAGLKTGKQKTDLAIQAPAAKLATGNPQSRYSAGVLTQEGVDWVIPDDSCPCSSSRLRSFCEEKVRYVDLSADPNNPLSAQGVICVHDCEEPSPWVRAALRERTGRIELEKREEALLTELGTSWECLHAVYEIGKASGCNRTTTHLLEVMVEQIRNQHPELKALVWLLEDENFVPVTSGSVSAHLFQSIAKDSLLGLIKENRSRIEEDPGAEVSLTRDLMLDRATSFALIPLSNAAEYFGMLQVWREGENPEFNSPLIRFLEALASHVTLSLENMRMRQEWLATEKIKHELSIGSEIQQRLLLASPPKQMPGLQIAVASLPSRQIGGDFVDFSQNGEGSLDLILGDVMGKGVPAALLAAAIKEEFQRARGNLVSSSELVPRPEAITNEAHRRLGTQLEDLECFATASFARFDVQSQTVAVVDCGHPKALHWRKRSGICEQIEGNNLPLGINPGEVYQQVSASFLPDDVFLFYTDGFSDARNSSGEFFGEQRLKGLLKKHHYLHPSKIIREIRRELAEFAGSQCFDDDVTCVVVKIGDSASICPLVRIEEELTSDIKDLGKIRALVDRICAPTPNIPEETRHHLEIGLTEALSNVIRHSYHRNPLYPISVHGENSGSQVRFRIYHWGESFIPEQEPRLDLSQESGFGLYLIAKTFDQTNYSTDEYGRTCIRLEKNLKGHNHEETK